MISPAAIDLMKSPPHNEREKAIIVVYFVHFGTGCLTRRINAFSPRRSTFPRFPTWNLQGFASHHSSSVIGLSVTVVVVVFVVVGLGVVVAKYWVKNLADHVDTPILPVDQMHYF